MIRRRRSNYALGLLLILAGAFFLARLFIPSLNEWLDVTFDWPMWIILSGALLFLFGLLVGAPGMAVPAAIVAGIGGILYYQNLSDDWASWSYLWTLIPGFVGVGTLVSGLLGDNPRQSIRSGISLMFISLLLLAIFASIFEKTGALGQYWPVLVILLGLWVLAGAALRRR
jgi:hypothetical protein